MSASSGDSHDLESPGYVHSTNNKMCCGIALYDKAVSNKASSDCRIKCVSCIISVVLCCVFIQNRSQFRIMIKISSFNVIIRM